MTTHPGGLKRRVYEILEPAGEGDRASRAFDIFLVALIALNALAVVLVTVDDVGARFFAVFDLLELVTIVLFSAEYGLRLWSATASSRFRGAYGRLRYALTPLALIDLLAVLPFFLPLLFNVDLRILRVLRLVRIVRILKLSRYSRALSVFARVFRAKREELVLVFFGMGLLLMIASSLMYAFEREAQPEAFSSIPASMWWGVSTLTLVGYGDVVPVTTAGRLVGALVQVLGIAFVALPTSLLGSSFAREMRGDRARCPHCGTSLDEA